MKYPFIVAIVGVAHGVALYLGFLNVTQPLEVENEKEAVIQEVEQDWTELLGDEDAVQAAKDVMQRKAWEAELEALEAGFEATTATYEAQKAEYLEAKTQLEKDLGTY